MANFSSLQLASSSTISILLFILIIAFYILGHFFIKKAIRKDPEHINVELGSINGALLALLGLILAFSFSMASSRFDTRRQLVIEEANNIGTAILRTDIYPDSIRKILKSNMKEYVEERIAFYESGMDVQKIVEHYKKADIIGKKIWSITADYAKKDNITTRTSELIPALNAMIDITTTRRAAGESTIPDSIMYFLFALCVCSAFLLGYDNKRTIDWIILIGFTTMLSLTVFTIIDLDRPRSGLINMDGPNQKMVELRQMFE
ncbi:MAG TPA: hypothetical protein P5188_11315 [Flavobacterium sp.]|nr:hypothetical protein [Flavobacterium sp.]